MPARWNAVIFYRYESGLGDVEHNIEELSEVEKLVDRWPHWDEVDRIEIKINPEHKNLTVEGSEDLDAPNAL